MHDIARPDHQCIFQVASMQMGYFTTAQARQCGFRRDLLTRHVQSGRFIRVEHGLYRLRDYPSSPQEELMVAWLSVGPDAVVSHDSALAFLELGTIIPSAIHLTIPRGRRYARQRPGVILHTTTRPITPADRIEREGIPITTPARTIVDVAASNIGPDQVEMSVAQALDRALATRGELEEQARGRDGRVQRLIARALARTGTS